MQRLDVLHHQVHHKEHRHRYKDSIMIDLNHYRRIDHRPIRDFICDFFNKLLKINWLDRNARAIDQKIKYNKSNKSHNEKNLEEKKYVEIYLMLAIFGCIDAYMETSLKFHRSIINITSRIRICVPIDQII